MFDAPPTLNLPPSTVLVEDVDEEIFLLYSRKQQLASSNSAVASTSPSGLGSHSDKEGVLSLSLAIKDPWTAAVDAGPHSSGRSKRTASSKSKKGKEKEEVTVDVELHQALDVLRHRKGDTGSVLWRVSLHLATYLLTTHHFPSPLCPPLLPALSTSSVLELGSGTGFLGLALRSIFASAPTESSSATKGKGKAVKRDKGADGRTSWTFSDQLASLPLVMRNLRTNNVDATPTFAVEELDWLAESSAWQQNRQPLASSALSGSSSVEPTVPPDLIIAADCIYNPSLSAPLAHTILRQAGPKTVVLVASELRDEEPLEAFLRTWFEEGGEKWRIARLAWDTEEEKRVAGELDGGQFVVWVGWQEQVGEEQ
ncbi:hypothetical protein JCM11251_002148 [Rhodosporidiobolus azoricus]